MRPISNAMASESFSSPSGPTWRNWSAAWASTPFGSLGEGRRIARGVNGPRYQTLDASPRRLVADRVMWPVSSTRSGGRGSGGGGVVPGGAGFGGVPSMPTSRCCMSQAKSPSGWLVNDQYVSTVKLTMRASGSYQTGSIERPFSAAAPVTPLTAMLDDAPLAAAKFPDAGETDQASAG